MKVLVTGGAGYIGSVVVEQLVAQGDTCVVYDNLSLGHAASIDPGATFVQGDLNDHARLITTLEHYEIKAVVHLAAVSLVRESMAHPHFYFANNVSGGITLLDAMRITGVKQLVYSSSAAVYGVPSTLPVAEDASLNPTSPYGESKLAVERMLPWHGTAFGLKYIILRYFNAAGASERYGEDHRPESHLIPNVLHAAAGRLSHVDIYGNDYLTADGTCIRDYVHVVDLASAHCQALAALQTKCGVYNVGGGIGSSVATVIKKAEQITGRRITTVVCPRRAGDPPNLVADIRKIQRELGWAPRHGTLDEILESAWRWQQAQPDGYPS